MARIGSATFPLQAGTVERQVPGGARLIGVRIEPGGLLGRAFAVVPNPAAPLETRKIHLVESGVDLPNAQPDAFRPIGIITTATTDWFVFEREIG